MKTTTALYKTMSGVALFAVLSVQGQSFTIANGTRLINSGSTQLVLKDAGLVNNGLFEAGTGTVKFTGYAAGSTSSINGASSLGFYNLNMAKTINGMQLLRSIAVSNTVVLSGGDSLDLNGFIIDLGSTGMLSGEINTRRITGANGGYIQRSSILNAPAGENPGNLGFAITSAANMGTVIIRRGHQQQSGASIRRYFEINATNNSSLAAAVAFYYTDTELAGVAEGNLALFSSANGGYNWANLGVNSLDVGTNILTVNNIDSFHRFTLANIGAPLAVRFLWITAKKEGPVNRLNWAAASTENKPFFDIERSATGLYYTVIGTVKQTGTAGQVQEYRFTDNSPLPAKNFYRLRQTDEAGNYSYSKAVMLDTQNGENQLSSIYPNPVAGDQLYLNLYSNSSGKTVIRIINAAGLQINAREFSVAHGLQVLTVPVHDLPPGLYYLQTGTAVRASLPFIRQ